MSPVARDYSTCLSRTASARIKFTPGKMPLTTSIRYAMLDFELRRENP